MRVTGNQKDSLKCPDCQENWLHGWTGKEMKEYLEGGVNKKGVAINMAICIRCSSEFSIPTVLSLMR